MNGLAERKHTQTEAKTDVSISFMYIERKLMY